MAMRKAKARGKKPAGPKKGAKAKRPVKKAKKPVKKAPKPKAAKPKAPKKKVAGGKAPAPKSKAPAAPALVARAGDFCHIEIPVADREAAKKFYGDVFGWSFLDAGSMDYTIFVSQQGWIAGGLHNPPPGVPRCTINYVLVDEIEPVVAKVEQAGGNQIVAKSEVPGIGWFALVSDPEGNVFGLWKGRQ